MAYAPGFSHDVFVSYSHIDNQTVERDGGLGWVDGFVGQLGIQLRKRLGSDAVDVYMDRELVRNNPLTPELLAQVRGSALLLVVMSPSYLKSGWCRRERNAFLELAHQRLAESRILIVNFLDVKPGERPPELGDLAAQDFWVHDRAENADRTLGEIDPQEPQYLNKVYGLSAQAARALGTLAAAAYGAARGAAPVPPSHGVFVARATDDLEDCEQELRNHILQAGLLVSPRRVYNQATQEDFEAAVRADLKGCRVFAQVLGPSKGSEMPYPEERRLPALLFALAQQAGVPTLQWRDRRLDLTAIADPSHRALVAAAVACPIEEFKRMVVDEATRRDAPAPTRRPPKVIVFVDRARDDHQLAERAAEALTRDGAQVYFPIDEGSPEEIRKDLEGALCDADGVLVVFGNSEVASVRARLRQHTKVLCQRDTAPAAIAIAEGPPGTHETLEQLRSSMLDPDIMIIDGAEGLSAQHLAPFIARLRSHPRPAA